MPIKDIFYLGQPCTLACDGQCNKAWGLPSRPTATLNPKDEDDYAFLADHELGEAPEDPGTYEGAHGKPINVPHQNPALMNKWCARACERSVLVKRGDPITLPDFSKRFYNIPGRHQN